MDVTKFHEIRVRLMNHDMNCPDPDKMYYVELAELSRFSKAKLEELYMKMEADGNEEAFEKVLEDTIFMDEMFHKYGILNEQPALTPEEQEQAQTRCIRNVMNDLSITVEQAMALLTIKECEREKYASLFK